MIFFVSAAAKDIRTCQNVRSQNQETSKIYNAQAPN